MSIEPDAVKILLVDDHPLVRHGLAGLLRDEGYKVAGIAASAEEAESLMTGNAFDLAIVDLTLEHSSGFDILASVRRLQPAAIAVVYSVHEDGARVRRAIQAGAAGYVTKREDPEVLLQCLREVRSGERFLSPRAARAVTVSLTDAIAPIPEETLSPKELAVFKMTGQGYTAQDTAGAMGLSVRTVETYYSRIMEKMNLSGRRELRLQATEWVRTSLDR